MKISVRSITRDGFTIDTQKNLEELGLAEEEMQITSPVDIKVKLERVNNFVLAHTDISAKYHFTCAKCLEEFESRQEHHFDFDYEIEKGIETIDLGDDIRQELIMDIAPRMLCKPDCKGICPTCGVDLNREECKCQ